MLREELFKAQRRRGRRRFGRHGRRADSADLDPPDRHMNRRRRRRWLDFARGRRMDPGRDRMGRRNQHCDALYGNQADRRRCFCPCVLLCRSLGGRGWDAGGRCRFGDRRDRRGSVGAHLAPGRGLFQRCRRGSRCAGRGRPRRRWRRWRRWRRRDCQRFSHWRRRGKRARGVAARCKGGRRRHRRFGDGRCRRLAGARRCGAHR